MVYPASISDTTDKLHSWSPAGDILTLMSTHGPMTIQLDKIKPAVDLLFGDLASTLLSLFPSQVEVPPEPKLDLKDTLDAIEPFVDQHDFLALFSPLYARFTASMRSPNESHHQIWSNNKFQSKNFAKWLLLEQEALRKIFLILLFTGGGISPRAFSITALQYRNTPTNKRNLYFFHGALSFAWPKAKGNSWSKGGLADSLYSYPPQLNWSLFIYLGIIRRFTIEVMREQKWSLGQIEYTLFTYTGANVNCGTPWKAAFMNSVSGSFSEDIFNSQLRVSDFRQLTQSIHSLHFQKNTEMEGIVVETANQMGNHSPGVAIRYYGKTNLTVQEWSQICYACSKAWHCWLGLISHDSTISSHLGQLPILQRRRNQVIAGFSATAWIGSHGAQISPIKSVKEFLDKLLLKVRPKLSPLFEVFKTPFTREHQNMNCSVKLQHVCCGVEKVHHF